MRVDTAMPRTWLLAALAGWALLAWVLALAGMGRHARLLDADPSLLPPLPQFRTGAPAPLGPLAQYDQVAARPLFAQDRQPKPFALQGEGGAEAAKTFDFVLSSVLITPQLKMAILQSPDRSQSLRVKLGEAPESQPSWRLVALSPRSAVFEGPEGQRTMDLRVFDGTGGEAPTAIARPGATPVGQSVPPASAPMPAAPAARPTAGVERPGPQGPAAVASPSPAPTNTAAANAQNANAQPMTSEQQMEAIRKRIEARRAQLRQQQAQQQAQSPAKDQ